MVNSEDQFCDSRDKPYNIGSDQAMTCGSLSRIPLGRVQQMARACRLYVQGNALKLIKRDPCIAFSFHGRGTVPFLFL
jgi:hypothetical protein